MTAYAKSLNLKFPMIFFHHSIISGLLIIFFTLKVSYAFARFSRTGEIVGKIIIVRGQVNITFVDEDLPRTLVKGQELIPGDIIVTAENGRAAVILSDDTQFKINENSTVIIQNVWSKKEKQGKESILNLIDGEIWTKINKGPRLLKIKTPIATALVRGGECITKVDSTKKTLVKVSYGDVLLSNKYGQVKVSRNETGIAEKGQVLVKMHIIDSMERTQWIYFMPESLRYIYFHTNNVQILNTRLKEVEEALRRNNSLDLELEKAEVYHDLGYLSKSLALFKETVKIRSDPRALTGMALIFMEKGDWDSGKKKINSISPAHSSPWAQIARASLCIHENKFKEAFDLWPKTEKLDNCNETVIAGFAHMLLLRGDINKAVSFCENALNRFPNSPLIYTFLKDAYILLDKSDETKILISEILSKNHWSALSHFDMALYLDKVEGNEKDALKQYKKALELSPENPSIISNLGNLLRQMGLYDQSLAIFEKSLSKGFKNTEILYNYGLLLSQVQKNRKALLFFSKAKKGEGELRSSQVKV